MDEKTLARVLDEMAIPNVLACNMRGADRCDLELLQSTYWADAAYCHIFTEGNAKRPRRSSSTCPRRPPPPPAT